MGFLELALLLCSGFFLGFLLLLALNLAFGFEKGNHLSVWDRFVGVIPILRHGNNDSVSLQLFDELEELARIVDITYCVGMTGLGIRKPFECASRCKDFPDFELVSMWNTGPLLSDSCGYIALSHNSSRVIVAFRGTYSITNTIADLSAMPQEFAPYPGGKGEDTPKCENCTVHTGFYASWKNTRDEILPFIEAALMEHPSYALTLVGHSLGGAVAAFAGIELLSRGFKPSVTTFGEPRIGNEAFARYVDARFNGRDYRRVTHVGDPVPLLPLEEWGYVPHGNEIFISKSELPPGPEDVHHCNSTAEARCIDAPTEGWFPSRFKLWELFFSHRDYFWRLGLCIPVGEPFWGRPGDE
ncbi:alpha/beta-hydrolase [Trichodelitschia bisporula]|uniref:Alpha/beta-hydrolase n=1 Tax=Trichodelitschia bisporula TaxID=703511 RepID=A0A6G1IAT6_9PEZI|nr:alpha/beta-hydrolase [Trichodelitschia bisporula]